MKNDRSYPAGPHGQSTYSINPDLIERIVETPDTNLHMVDGTTHVVGGSMGEVIDLIARYRAPPGPGPFPCLPIPRTGAFLGTHKASNQPRCKCGTSEGERTWKGGKTRRPAPAAAGNSARCARKRRQRFASC